MSRPTGKKCYFGCQKDTTLFSFPKDETTRQKWLDFVFGNQPPPKKIVYVCSKHFTEDCFTNGQLFDCGQVTRLSLKPNSIPTIRVSGSSADSTPKPFWITKRSVSTQLSAGTLGKHYRSKSVQTTPTTENRGIVSEKPMLQFSSTQIKPPSSEGSKRAAKKPCLDIKEEEEDTDISIPLPHDSTYDPGELSALAEMDSASDYEDAKYIVFESCLRELFETCPVCKHHCNVQRWRCGTFVAFSQVCPQCSYSRRWQSQPLIESAPVGDLQLSGPCTSLGDLLYRWKRSAKP